MRKVIFAIFAAAIAVTFGGVAKAYPDRPVHLIVPFSPGGGTDVLARLVGQKLSEALGQQVVIDNRPGAGGSLGTEHAAHAEADGYSILIANALTHTAKSSLYKDLDYDPVTDFAPIGMFGASSYVLVVDADFPVKDYKAFADLISGDPGKYNYASAGVGSATHLAMELFKSASGFEIVHIPYNGSGPALNDVVSGIVPIALDNILAVTELAKGEMLRPLAISGKTRSESFPDVPTFAEVGLTDLGLAANWGLLAPAGTPDEVIAVLSEALRATVLDPKINSQLMAQGIAPEVSTPEDFGALLKSESAKWSRLIEEAQIQP